MADRGTSTRPRARWVRLVDAVLVSTLAISASCLAWRGFAADRNTDDVGWMKAPGGGAEASPCSSCGTDRPRTTSHPVLSRSTVAASEYLRVLAESARSGVLIPADVDEVESMIRASGNGDEGDAAVYAVRASGDMLASGAMSPVVAERLAGVLLEAASDPRPRVRWNARVQWDRLGRTAADGDSGGSGGEGA